VAAFIRGPLLEGCYSSRNVPTALKNHSRSPKPESFSAAIPRFTGLSKGAHLFELLASPLGSRESRGESGPPGREERESPTWALEEPATAQDGGQSARSELSGLEAAAKLFANVLLLIPRKANCFHISTHGAVPL